MTEQTTETVHPADEKAQAPRPPENVLFLRNVVTGEIRELEPFSEEHKEIRLERDDDNQFVWQETSAADAFPEKYAHPTEVAARSRFGVEPLSFVTSDGTPTSKAGEEALAKVTQARVHGPAMHEGLSRDPAHPEAGPSLHVEKPRPRRKPASSRKQDD